jgi:hypothetical protein
MPKKDLSCFTTKEKRVVCKDASTKAGKEIASNKKDSKSKVKKDTEVKVSTKKKPKLKIVEVIKPKVSEKAKKIIAAGKTTNRLEDLPSELTSKIMEHKKEAEDADTDKLDQKARTLPLVKKRAQRLWDETIENEDYSEGVYGLEEDMRDDFRLVEHVGTTKNGDKTYKFTNFAHSEANGLLKLPKKRLEYHDLVDSLNDLVNKQTLFNFREILIKDINKKKKGEKLKTNKEILDKYWK